MFHSGFAQSTDILYRLFYTVFSMSCMAVAMLPLVLVLRFCFRKLPKQFCTALWAIFFLRAVCPVGMSSPVCLFGTYNRQFHRLLRSIGLEMIPDRGVLSSWRMVYLSDIKVTVPYMVCSVIGILGCAALILYRMVWLGRLRQRTAPSVHLFDHVYQTEGREQPFRRGVFRKKICLPEGLSAREMKNILAHQQAHVERHDDLMEGCFYVICCLHWWNPLIWAAYYLAAADREMACDERAVRKLGWRGGDAESQGIVNGYIQDNFHRMEGNGRRLYFPVLLSEVAVSARTEHLLYLERASIGREAIAAFVVSVVFVGGFGLSALHAAWNGGTWAAEAEQEDSLPKSQKRGVTNEVIAACDTETADGEAVRLELVMTQGTYQSGRGYQGQCILRMRGDGEDSLASLLLSAVFTEQRVQKFDENMELAVEDYNEDGTMEVALGQQTKVRSSDLEVSSAASDGAIGEGAAVSGDADEKKAFDADRSTESGADSTAAPFRHLGERDVTLQEYFMVNIEKEALKVISDPIYVSDVTSTQAGSLSLSAMEGLGGVIQTTADGKTLYYVWNEDEEKYRLQAMTETELQARRHRQGRVTSGEEFTYTLKNGKDKIVMQVEAVADDTGGQVIQEVSLNPRGVERASDTKKWKNVDGYFRELQWAQTDGEEERFAVLSYNGESGGSFVLYDMDSRKACYQQEDGNRVLQEIFEKYNGKDITFDKDDAVVYRLMEISGDDTLKVTFAADTREGVTVQGTFLYKLSTKELSGLQFSQNIGE